MAKRQVLEGKLNNEPAFGLRSPGVEDKIKKAFCRRIHSNSKVMEGKYDHKNYYLVKMMFDGLNQVEPRGTDQKPSDFLGLPVEIYQNLNTSSIPAMLVGLSALTPTLQSEHGHTKVDSNYLGNKTCGDIVYNLIDRGFTIQNNMSLGAKSAIVQIHNSKLGYTEHNRGSLISRINDLSEDVRTQFLRSLYSMKFFSQEQLPNDFTYWDPVLAANHRQNGDPIDGQEDRKKYVENTLNIIQDRQEIGNVFDTSTFEGWIVPSFRYPETTEYFVEATKLPRSGRTHMRCTCPDYLINTNDKCKHIRSARKPIQQVWI